MVRWWWVNFQCRGILLIWLIVGQGPIVLAVGAGGGCFKFVYLFFFLPLSESARYRLKYVLNPPKNNKTNPVESGMRTQIYGCYHIYSKVSDKNAFRSVDSDLTTHSVILDSISRRFVVVLNLQNSFPAGSFQKGKLVTLFQFLLHSAFFFL